MEQNFEFREKPDENISVGWKLVQILCYTFNVIVSAIAYVTFISTSKSFDGYCMLYSNVHFAIKVNITLQPYEPFHMSLVVRMGPITHVISVGVCALFVNYIFQKRIVFFTMCGGRRTQLHTYLSI
jgi:hypothetical protein